MQLERVCSLKGLKQDLDVKFNQDCHGKKIRNGYIVLISGTRFKNLLVLDLLSYLMNKETY